MNPISIYLMMYAPIYAWAEMWGSMLKPPRVKLYLVKTEKSA